MRNYDDDDDTSTTTTISREPFPDSHTSEKRMVIRRGWGAAEATKNADSPFAQNLKLGEDPVVVRFLEDEPYASYRQHWVERSGKKSFTCISDIDDRGCPLCEVGNRPATRFAFNVAVVSNDGNSIKSYDVGPRVIDQLKNFHTDPRQGPLTRHYWAISRTGKGTTSATNHQMIKERDLEDEWRVSPISEEELVTLRKACYGPDIINIPQRKELMEIAAEES